MNVYLIYSDSFRMIEEEITKILKDNAITIKFDMNQFSVEELILEAGYLTLLNEPKYIIAKNALFFGNSKLSDKDMDLLLNYLNNPNPETTIIFTTTTKIDERKKITKVLRNKYIIIEIAKLNEYEMNKKIVNSLKKDGYKIDYDSAQHIIRSSLNNYDIIYNELEKIKMFYGDNKDILLSDLKKLTAHNIEDNIFKLIDAIIDRKTKEMFKLYRDLKIIKVEPITIIYLLAREYRNMYLIKTNKNYSNTELIKIMGMQKWQFDKSAKRAYSYDVIDLKEKLQELYNLDLKIKRGKIEKYMAIELFMLNI